MSVFLHISHIPNVDKNFGSNRCPLFPKSVHQVSGHTTVYITTNEILVIWETVRTLYGWRRYDGHANEPILANG